MSTFHLLRFVFACQLIWTLASSGLAEDALVTRTWKRQELEKRFFCEGATFGDLNKDGQGDLVSGPFWYEGPTFEKRHEYYPAKPFDPSGYSDNFFAYTPDISGDGWNDILIIGFPGREAFWYENPGKPDGEWKRHLALETVDNESPTFVDITGDGKPEIVCSQKGSFGYASWNADKPGDKWIFHPISKGGAGGNFTHGLGVGDVNSDGRADLLEQHGWWEQPESLIGDPEWKKHAFEFNGGGAQMFAYDVNGDKRNDVITSIHAHGFGLVWWEQVDSRGEPKFEKHVITGDKVEDSPYGVKFSQIHAIDLVDMDGDGLKDIVTGKRWWAHGAKGDAEPDAPAVVYWFKLTRSEKGGVDWVPYLIDDNSGVGTQIIAGDFSGDGVPDVVVGNKKGTFALTQVVTKASQEEYEQAQPKKRRTMAQGLSPEEAAKAMTVPPGFSVQLFAGEPDVIQPIAMAFDDRGRLWVAEAYTYPQRAPEGKGKDRILIFEDTDGDGKHDKRSVFIEGLNLVSGLELGFGGVYVGAAPYLLFIPDADGDDKPDAKPQILLDGWGYQDTHETLNSFIWGPDGWLYGCHGVFTHSNVGKPGTPDDKRTKINAGIWRYHPTRHEFEVFAEGTSNPWGLDFNDRGQAFATACVIPHLYHIIQGGRYQRQAGQHFNPYTFDDIKTIAKHRHWVGGQWEASDREKSLSVGGGHAHAGAMIYLGGAWPEKYRNQLFMNNIHGARLNQDQLTAKGSGYEGDAAPDFLFANDVWSQIIYLTYGPDGQVYMIDWYDKNQCHHGNSPGHDRTNGRIFKVSYGKTEPVKGLDLKKLSNEELLDLQFHENEWYVRHARRILQERRSLSKAQFDSWTPAQYRGEAKRAALEKKLAEPAITLRILWTLNVTGILDDLKPNFGDEDEFVRAWKIQLFVDDRKRDSEFCERLVKLAEKDKSPIVRLYLASALQRLMPEDSTNVAKALVRHAEDASDHNLPLMYWYGIEPMMFGDIAGMISIAETSKIPIISRLIVRKMAAEEFAHEELLSSLAEANEATQLWMLEEIVAALKLRANLKMPDSWKAAYEKLASSPNPVIAEQAEYIAVKFGDERVLPALRTTLADRTLELSRRKLALDALLAGKDRELPGILHGILQGLIDEEQMRLAAINALAAFDDRRTPAVLAEAYAQFSVAEKQATIATLASRPSYVLAMLDAIEQEIIPREDLTAFTVRQLAAQKDERVIKRLNEVWGTIRETSADKTAELNKYKKLLQPEVLAKANLPHGRELYNKTCGACHKLFNSGKEIGPEITGSNRANLDYLLENLLDPSAVVGKAYQVTQVVTTNGRTISGILKDENDTAITLQAPTEIVTIPKSEIDERELSKLSLMPDGQLKPLPADDVRDLIAYLASPAQVPLPGEGPFLDPKTGKVAGALEGESLKIVKKSAGNAGAQDMSGFNLGKWSNQSQLWWTGAKPGDKLELELPVAKTGKYEVFAVLTKAIDYAEVKISLADMPLGGKFDGFNDGVVNQLISLGEVDLKAGAHRLTFEITGANPKAVKGYMVGLDYVYLSPK